MTCPEILRGLDLQDEKNGGELERAKECCSGRMEELVILGKALEPREASC